MTARGFQHIMREAAYFLDFSRPETIVTAAAHTAIVKILTIKQITAVLLVTDPGIASLGLHLKTLEALHQSNIVVSIYDKTVPNPTIDDIEAALGLYKTVGAHAIIGFGGGSAIDCAKGVAARIANPRKSISQMRGLLKVGRRKTVLIAVPTTAGTGSEATLAAVITDAKTHEKYAINDPVIMPRYAVLDAGLTIGLPPHITASTGMDALTHAVEAYIGRANTRKTRHASLKAIWLIHENLLEAYANPTSLKVRQAMQTAALEAGVAFTRAYVGHVHGLAHQLGGYYQVPHGLANAIILPLVLRELGTSVHRRLAELADFLKLPHADSSIASRAEAFIAWVEGMNAKMNLTNNFGSRIKDEHIPILAKRAHQEVYPLYPVPQLWEVGKYTEMYRQLQIKEQ